MPFMLVFSSELVLHTKHSGDQHGFQKLSYTYEGQRLQQTFYRYYRLLV
jgi:hypothetical protein